MLRDVIMFGVLDWPPRPDFPLFFSTMDSKTSISRSIFVEEIQDFCSPLFRAEVALSSRSAAGEKTSDDFMSVPHTGQLPPASLVPGSSAKMHCWQKTWAQRPTTGRSGMSWQSGQAWLAVVRIVRRASRSAAGSFRAAASWADVGVPNTTFHSRFKFTVEALHTPTKKKTGSLF